MGCAARKEKEGDSRAWAKSRFDKRWRWCLSKTIAPSHSSPMESQLAVDSHSGQQSASECRLGQIYAVDALSFLNHSRLQRCRLVSGHWNECIEQGRVRGKLRAREEFTLFYLGMVLSLHIHNIVPSITHITRFQNIAGNVQFTEDGFGHLKSCRSRDWRTIAEYHPCCRDWLSTAAAPLAGQRIFSGAAPNASVHFSFNRERGRRDGSTRILLLLRNELTSASAATLLHFACHVAEELCFEGLRLRWSDLGTAPTGQFNPGILSALARRRGGETAWIRTGTLDSCAETRAFALENLQDSLRDMLLLGSFNLRLRESPFGPYDYTSPEHLSNLTRFLTHCGKCVSGRAVTIDNSSIEVPLEPRDLIEPVIKACGCQCMSDCGVIT